MTTLFVASTGGHLGQLREVAARLPDPRPAVWVTHDSPQSRSLLAGEDVVHVPDVGVRDLRGVLRGVPHAARLHRERGITRAVSTGSGIALGYLPYLAARGVECHYVESATRVAGPSVTGRVLQRLPRVHLYTQYRHWAGGRWHYGGNVFDGYHVQDRRRPDGGPLRVVVTVGIATGFPFRRLLERLVPLLRDGGELSRATGRPVEVLWQTAGTPTDGLPISARPTLPAAELSAAVRAADVVVSHAGTGSAIAVLDGGRLPVLAPRLPARGEAGDGHQVQLAAELRRRGLARVADAGSVTVEDLLATVHSAVGPTTPPAFALTGART